MPARRHPQAWRRGAASPEAQWEWQTDEAEGFLELLAPSSENAALGGMQRRRSRCPPEAGVDEEVVVLCRLSLDWDDWKKARRDGVEAVGAVRQGAWVDAPAGAARGRWRRWHAAGGGAPRCCRAPRLGAAAAPRASPCSWRRGAIGLRTCTSGERAGCAMHGQEELKAFCQTIADLSDSCACPFML